MTINDVLKELLECFYVDDDDGGLHWKYIEGYPAGDFISKEVNDYLIKLHKKEYPDD